MLAKCPRDKIEQILIVISFEWLLARWWMVANLPLSQALERVFNMTIKCLSFRFYCIFPSCRRLCPPPFSSHPPLFFLFLSPLSWYNFICTVQLLCRLNWDSGFLHLTALTYVLWHAVNQFYVGIDFCPPSYYPLTEIDTNHFAFCSTSLPTLVSVVTLSLRHKHIHVWGSSDHRRKKNRVSL